MKKEIVDVVIKKCMGYRKGECVLIVTDDALEGLAQPFFRHLREMKIEATLLVMKQRGVHGEEPPKGVAEALKMADIALLMTHKSLSHTKARRQACHRYGTRIASMPGITFDVINRSLDIDYNDLRKKAHALSRVFSRARTLRVRTKAGTDLMMSIEKRKGHEDTGLYLRRGAFGNLPAGEACVAPMEGSAQGVVVVDASMAGIGKISKPIKLTIKGGGAAEISSAKLRYIIRPFGPLALNLAEFGVGLNPKAKVSGNVLEDEKVIGTAHVALGDNISFGGKVRAPCHLDGVFFDPTVIADGKKII